MSETVPSLQITVTDDAKYAVMEAVKDLDKKWYLRIFIQNSPSGLRYAMAVDTNVHSQDEVFSINGLDVVVDEISRPFVLGATVDFVNQGETKGFKISNPHVDLSAIGGACGGGACGAGGCCSTSGGGCGSGGCC